VVRPSDALYKGSSQLFGRRRRAMRWDPSLTTPVAQTQKRGGVVARRRPRRRAAPEPDRSCWPLDEALHKLAGHLPRQVPASRVARNFAGLTGEHACGVLNISQTTADRLLWPNARAWLQTEVPAAKTRDARKILSDFTTGAFADCFAQCG